MAWNVKNEMPMGSAMPGSGSERPNTPFMLSMRKSVYLKKTSVPMLHTIAAPQKKRRFFGKRAMASAAR